jgi:hypothetical protein
LHRRSEKVKQNNLSAALSALDEDFERIEGYDVVTDGTYWAVLEDVSVELPDSSSSPRIVWKLRILGPTHYGGHVQRYLVITRDTLRWLKKDMYVCGVSVTSLADLPGRLDNLLNLKVRVRTQARSVHIIDADTPASVTARLFLHLIDEKDEDYLDQQLGPRQQPRNQEEFESLINHFVSRYQCPNPHRAYIEDAKTGAVIFSTDQP